jgi:hypothetical protein
MRIRNLLVLTITIVIGTLSVSGQDRKGATTFTDQSNRSITISRFGTVLNFKNGDGKEAAPANTYRVCPCGEKTCIESATIPDDKTDSKFEVEFPKKGTTIDKGETLVATSSFRHGDLTISRRLSWEAGSNLVKIDDVISSPKSLCACAFEEEKPPVKVLLDMKMCPRPPIPGFICPPYNELSSDAMKRMTVVALLSF